ncbi:MAG: gamma-glutamyl-gamma-aminobutyrate hydrolase family protein [Alphaproteobacteria bacterium]|nr:gamma-glutamyl-gamma-aminobutyrate hydrolase family protein [Alphaproteobacteria bacterium]MBV9153625.1 gamma-glutamyl-gamma-aminobutyrate hydrolase family protein [Alphaproteobacteria bacterium]
MSGRTVPLIGIPSCVRSIHERSFHTVNERYPNAIIDAAHGLPLIIPAIGPRTDCGALLDRLDGLLLTGSPSNVEPHHYSGPPSREGTLHDPDRDATTLPLIREAVRRDMPVLAICRGIQELNVALGGTLHQRIFEMPERFNHKRRHGRGPMTSDEERYGPAHPVMLTPGGLLARLAGTTEIMVNSLHGQGIDRPAPDLLVEAVAPDGQIEAVSLPGARFVVGVQWHPEYKPLANPFSKSLFEAFSQAAHATLTRSAAKRRAA